ncbi:MAG: DUF2971 domain-containing protein [Chromatiales bacterium]|nr:DUF2971 domain-containing protein [Chromatiales bacterium]
MWKDDFFALMGTPTISIEAINRAQTLKDKHIPKFVYKYRAINDYSVKNLDTDTVWLSMAAQFNDPYDCCMTFDSLYLTKIIAKIDFESLIKRGALQPHLSEKEIDAAKNSDDPYENIIIILLEREKSINTNDRGKMAGVFKSILIDRTNEMIEQWNKYMQENTPVCSFSERADSTVMWGHYADSHKGFCVEYPMDRLLPNDPRRRGLFPVTYSDELFDATPYFEQSIMHRSFNNLFGILSASRKAMDWSYEREWRLTLPIGQKLSSRNYLMPPPSAVYLGTRISEQGERQIREICARKDVPVKRMRLSPKEFKLTPED